ncbi:hypothetical protein PRUPE_3G226100 [Prunus persica]|uniref:non-specific serine/threonine protein kinase n=1 Tax=Prunus persica TaxID=3760 RepID=A0A251Q7F0_PRUPE|nr:hypothetical protein PRUPE_3G226100 [Prunus persica]
MLRIRKCGGLLQNCTRRNMQSLRDTLTYDTPIRGDVKSETLVSAGGKFELGFFTPLNSSAESYVGIWYHNLRLEPIKSSNLTVRLMDSGNLVLFSDDGEDDQLVVQNNQDDPRIGNFTFKLDQEGDNQYVISRKSIPYWKSGEQGEFSTSAEMPPLITYLLSNFRMRGVSPKNLTRLEYNYTRLVMNFIWEPQFLTYKKQWNLRCCNRNNRPLECKCLPGFSPQFVEQWNSGDFSGGCARQSKICEKNDTFLSLTKMKLGKPNTRIKVDNETVRRNECLSNCLCQAYSYAAAANNTRWDASTSSLCWTWLAELNNLEEEYGDDGHNISVRIALSDSETVSLGTTINPYPLSTGPDGDDPMYSHFNCSISIGQVSFVGPNGIVFRVISINPSAQRFVIQAKNVDNCDPINRVKSQQLNPPFPFNVTKGNLQQTQEQQIEEQPISKVRVSLMLITVAVVTSGIFLACIIFVYTWRRKITKRQDKINRAQLDSERRVQELIDTGEFKEEDEKGIDVPFFDLQSILDATDSFSEANKLGQGGYGPVYKLMEEYLFSISLQLNHLSNTNGKFLGDQEISVKRLSSASGQGLQEFKNEVLLIAKLQHRNLVRLKGYCIKDHAKSMVLDWGMRFNMILGITCGLLYLHLDSRLRIIHRDLKTSNVLLDEEMNPKISDFGLARIVGGKETESNTNTIVGTYGYMSPEYALEGTFSVKSDVYSFGVVLLEIISGKKNIGFYQSKQTFSLINYVSLSNESFMPIYFFHPHFMLYTMLKFKLFLRHGDWTENKGLELTDKTLDESCNKSQFIKRPCCVDRPTMSNVPTMLDSEIAISSTPEQPAFLLRRFNSSTASSSTKPETFAEVTTTLDEGR